MSEALDSALERQVEVTLDILTQAAIIASDAPRIRVGVGWRVCCFAALLEDPQRGGFCRAIRLARIARTQFLIQFFELFLVAFQFTFSRFSDHFHSAGSEVPDFESFDILSVVVSLPPEPSIEAQLFDIVA